MMDEPDQATKHAGGLQIRHLATLLVLVALYVASAKLGLTLAFVHPSATAVWPPTGLAIAATLLFGYRVWPAWFAGAFVANLTTAGSIATSVGIATGNTLEALVGAWLVNRYAGGRLAFEKPASVFRFAFLAAALAPVISATVGVMTLLLGGYAARSNAGAVWATWWLGDASGALLVAPVLVLWSGRPSLHWPRVRLLEVVGFFLVLALVSQAVFDNFDIVFARNYPLDFLCVPLLLWAAFRLGPRIAAVAIFLLSALAVWGTWRGFGPFANSDLNASLLLLQLFMGVLAITSLTVAAAIQQRERVEAERNHLLIAEQEARRQAEAATRAREEFLSIASHELRTPVTTLKGYAQLLIRRQSRGELDAQDLDQSLALMEKSAIRLGVLVEKLLDISRIEAGQLALDCREVELATLVGEAIDRAQDLYKGGHTFSIDLATHPSTVWADADQMDQVLTNLIENAVKYTPAGGNVRVRLRKDAHGGFLLTVQDTGIGLPGGAAEAIFEPFRRASNATAGQIQGLGLGLHICRTIVQRHGGQIWAESPGEGQGTTLCVWLPAAPDTVMNSQTTSS